MPTVRECSCGSGLSRRELRDAAGIFCTFVCDVCIEEKRRHFNPEIFDTQSAYAISGDEEDLT